MNDVGLVGRDRELARLRRAVGAASAGNGGVLLVAGEAGIGKTALVARFANEVAGAPANRVANRVAGAAANEVANRVVGAAANEVANRVVGAVAPVLTGRSVADEAAPALWPWRRLLDGAGLDGLSPELLESTVDPAVDPAAARFQVADRVARALRAAAEPGGLVVVLDDLHWADEGSLMLLRHLCGEVIGSRLLVVGTFRDGEGLPPVLNDVCAMSSVETMRLGPLTVQQVGEYLGPAHPSWAEHVHRRGGGNPLYVREFARVLVQDGLLNEPARELPLPTELGRLVDYRLRRLSPGCYALLGVASAIGDEFDLDLLGKLVNATAHGKLVDATALGRLVDGTALGRLADGIALGELADGTALSELADGTAHATLVDETALVDEAVRAGVLVDGDRLRFSHAVIREARYGELSRSERIKLHRTIAEAIQQDEAIEHDDDRAGEVAKHLLRADEPELAERACLKAGRAAARQRAFEEAHSWYQKLTNADAEVLVEAATAAYGAGRLDDALRRCVEAADAAEAAGRGDLLAAAALVVRGIGTPPPNAIIVNLCERARALLPDGDVATRAQLLAQQAFATTEILGVPPAEPLSVEALELAEQCGEPTALIAALHARHQVLLFPDAVAERLALGTRLRQLAGRVERPDAQLWSHMWRVEAHLQLGALAELDTELQDLATLAERVDWPITRWYLLRAQAARALLIGRFADAQGRMERARDVALGSQLRTAMPLFWSQLQDVLRLTGRFAELDPEVPVIAGQTPLPLAWALFGRFLWEAGDRDAALGLYGRVREALPGLREDNLRRPTIAVAAELAAASRDEETAEFCYAQLQPYAHYYLYSASGCFGAAARLLGGLAAVLGRVDEADRHFADAVAMERRIGALPFLVLAQLDHAAALLAWNRPGHRDRAIKLVERAAHTAGRLGMAPASARAADLSAALASAGGEQPLTAREQEIAALVATGLANRAIAERLVLSERTVESHVRSILTKLQLTNRTQVAAWATRRART